MHLCRRKYDLPECKTANDSSHSAFREYTNFFPPPHPPPPFSFSSFTFLFILVFRSFAPFIYLLSYNLLYYLTFINIISFRFGPWISVCLHLSTGNITGTAPTTPDQWMKGSNLYCSSRLICIRTQRTRPPVYKRLGYLERRSFSRIQLTYSFRSLAHSLYRKTHHGSNRSSR